MKKNIAPKVTKLINPDAVDFKPERSVSCCGFRVKFGDVVRAKSFAFSYPSGGTGLSRWEEDKFEGEAEFVVVNAWYDYETGVRMWALPYDAKTKEWLENKAKKDTSEGYFNEPVTVAYLSQFDLVED